MIKQQAKHPPERATIDSDALPEKIGKSIQGAEEATLERDFGDFASEIENEKKVAYQRFAKKGLTVDDLEVFDLFASFRAAYVLSERGKIPRPARGIILFGPVGCGKTSLVQAALFQIGFEYVEATTIIEEYRQYGEGSFITDKERWSNKDLILDDLGAEQNAVVFGNKFSLAEWLEWRYRCFKRFGALTVITTNLQNRQKIAEQYDDRIRSRILEMCDAVKYRHSDRREEEFNSRTIKRK